MQIFKSCHVCRIKHTYLGNIIVKLIAWSGHYLVWGLIGTDDRVFVLARSPDSSFYKSQFLVVTKTINIYKWSSINDENFIGGSLSKHQVSLKLTRLTDTLGLNVDMILIAEIEFFLTAHFHIITNNHALVHYENHEHYHYFNKFMTLIMVTERMNLIVICRGHDGSSWQKSLPAGERWTKIYLGYLSTKI